MLNNYRIGYRFECTDKYIGTGESFFEVQAESLEEALKKADEYRPNISGQFEIIYIFRINLMQLPIRDLLHYGTA